MWKYKQWLEMLCVAKSLKLKTLSDPQCMNVCGNSASVNSEFGDTLHSEAQPSEELHLKRKAHDGYVFRLDCKTFTCVHSQKKTKQNKQIHRLVRVLRRNVNTGQRWSSLRTLQGVEMCKCSRQDEKSWSH